MKESSRTPSCADEKKDANTIVCHNRRAKDANSSSSSSSALPGVSISLNNPNSNATVDGNADTPSKTHSFIEGYDNAVVQTNIHIPADAQPVRATRPPNFAFLEGIANSPLASQSGLRLATVPEGSKYSAHTDALLHIAKTGKAADIEKLADWANLLETENDLVRVRLKKQQHDFASLFEMVSAMSARAMDVSALQSCMLRTVAGHFTTQRLMIVRRAKAGERHFQCTASQGLNNVQITIDMKSQLCRFAWERGAIFSLRELAEVCTDSPELEALQALDIETALPLFQEVDGAGAVLEGFLFIGPKLTRKPYNKHDIEFLEILSKMFAICLRNENLYRRSIVDTLTGVSSRGHFDAQLSQEFERAADTGNKNMCLIMLDVDHFKRFNDKYGHQTGDLVLKTLAQTLVRQIRNVDLVARYGGEEFAIICVEIDKKVGREVADRLMNAVRDMEVIAPDGTALRVTASFGIASYPEDATDMHTLIQLADKALYTSKDEGRNRLTMAAPAQASHTELGTHKSSAL